MLFVATRAATAAVNGFGKGEGMKVSLGVECQHVVHPPFRHDAENLQRPA